MIEKALVRLAKLEERRPKAVLAVFVIFTILIFTGFGNIATDTNPESQVPDDISAIKALEKVRDKLGGGGGSITLIFRTDPEDPKEIGDIRGRSVLESMKILDSQIKDDDIVTGSRSILDIVDLGMTQNEINLALSEDPRSDGLVSEDRRITIAVFSLASGASGDQESELLFKIRNYIYYADIPPGVTVDLAGSPVLSEELGRSIGSSTGAVTLLGFVGVFVVLYIFFRRASFVAVTVLPIVLSTFWTFGTLGLIGIPLSSTLTGVFSIIIGLGIDFGIHILHRFEEDIKKESLEKALANAVGQVGKGLTLTTVTTITGFLALLSARLPLLQDFALSLSFGVLYSLVAAIGVIPPVIVLLERRRLRKSKKKSHSRRK